MSMKTESSVADRHEFVCVDSASSHSLYLPHPLRAPTTTTPHPPQRFQPWPESSLHSVARKFLDEVDLGDDAARAAVVEFMPFGFAAVNKVGRFVLLLQTAAAGSYPMQNHVPG
jgi:hypothetical protein